MLNPFLVSFKIRIHLNNGWEESIPRCDWVNSTLIQLSTTIPTRIGISDPKITCFSILGKYKHLVWIERSTGQSLLTYSDTDQVIEKLKPSGFPSVSLIQSSSELIVSHRTVIQILQIKRYKGSCKSVIYWFLSVPVNFYGVLISRISGLLLSI